MATFSCEHEVTDNFCSSRNISSDEPETNRWAVILAGGDGTRLRSLTKSISGDERPKQFCPVIGGRTLLDQTRRRVALSVEPQKTLTVVTRTHEVFYQSLLRDVPRDRLLVQPENKGTAPAILLSLLRIAQSAPDATVAFFPSDHFFTDDLQFMSHIDSAFAASQKRPELITLLGIKPDKPEVEYGWIEPHASLLGHLPRAITRVQRFWEKPSALVARGLLERGCLWNSFVMVGRVDAFLKMTQRALPSLYETFATLAPIFDTQAEPIVLDQIYAETKSTNFSQEVLALRPDDLSVMKVGNVGWTDLGEPRRVFSTLHHLGMQTQWAMPSA
ncbi:MAG TPA: sugar phosphate nucleotidyltransferase [Pyrinomonadaceae bacterium]|nr:sugar phosphate nucleotidyltransferase [Pyrinomonadaceae bacterium]